MISKDRIKLLPNWCITETHPAFYDTESKTAVGQTAKLYGAMKELQEDYNKYVNEINETIIAFINDANADQEEFINSINKIMHDYIAMIDEKIKMQDNVIEENITYIKENMINGLQEILNQMIESGELEESILNTFEGLNDRVLNLEEKQVINEKIRTVQTVEEMKELTDLTLGTVIKTIGYYSANDGGGATYLIREKLETDIEDNGAIHFINNSLVAELIIVDNKISVNQFGAKADGEIDDTQAIQNCFNFARAGITICFEHDRQYLINRTISVPQLIHVDGNNCHIMINENFENNSFVFDFGKTTAKQKTEATSYARSFVIKDFCFHKYGTPELLVNAFMINADAVIIKNIFAWGLNQVVKCTDKYVDKIKVDGIEIWGKCGSDYVIDTGYMGDAREIRNIHMHMQSLQTEEPNMLRIGSAHHGCVVDTVINGNILIDGGIASLKNLHLEGESSITINESEVIIESGYLWRGIKAPITINGTSHVELNNLTIAYVTERKDYSNIDCTDIYINSTLATVTINNCFKCAKGENMATSKHFVGLKTNIEQFNENANINSVHSVIRNNFTKPLLPIKKRDGNYGILGSFYTIPNIIWKESSGTYYYKAVMIFDKNRMVGNTSNANELSKELEEGGSSPSITVNGCPNSNYRFYRGKSAEAYNKYVDVGLVRSSFQDNGIIGGCDKWNDREESGIDTFLEATSLEYNSNNNVTVYAGKTPTVGTWKKGDRIINNNPVQDGIYGWVCTAEGTPGTWKAIGTIEG